jgi:hypothetical protein
MIHFIRWDTVFQGGGDVRGPPAPATFALLAAFLSTAPDTFLSIAPAASAPELHPPIHPVLHLSVHLLCPKHLEYLSTCTGICYVIKPGIIVDTYGHVLLGSY